MPNMTGIVSEAERAKNVAALREQSKVDFVKRGMTAAEFDQRWPKGKEYGAQPDNRK